MRELRAATSGRYTSTVGFRKLSVAGPEQQYELLVFEQKWSPVVPLNEWYRLRMHRGRLGAYATVERALDSLVDRGLAEREARSRVVVPDVFLRAWLRQASA